MEKEFSNVIDELEKGLSALIYRATKTIVTPVMGAIADTLGETIRNSVRDGVKDALPKPTMILENIFSGGVDDFLGKKK